MDNSELGRVLLTIRSRMGISQAELARRADLAVNTICLVENGKRSVLDKALIRIADALGVPASILKLLSDQADDPELKKLQEAAWRIVLKRVKLLKKDLVRV